MLDQDVCIYYIKDTCIYEQPHKLALHLDHQPLHLRRQQAQDLEMMKKVWPWPSLVEGLMVGASELRLGDESHGWILKQRHQQHLNAWLLGHQELLW